MFSHKVGGAQVASLREDALKRIVGRNNEQLL